jgi:23S rRNA (cytidine1920-2'-O)/16S rRNA (cytidine1409-2'-O)-methyltransferase
LKIVVPAVIAYLKKDARILALIKPQFEVGKDKVGKGGVVRDAALHIGVIENLSAFFTKKGFSCEKTLPSPIIGPKGNREFFILLRYEPIAWA